MTVTRDHFALELRGVGFIGLLAMAVILAGNLVVAPVSAILVLLWARRSGTPLQELGFVRPSNWVLTIAGGIALGVAFKLLMKAVAMPLLGAPPVNQPYHYLVGNTAALPMMLATVIIAAGLGEETVFRGYLFERFAKFVGTGAWAKTGIVLLTSVLFGLAHYAEQGVPGVQQATVVGLVFATIFAVTGKLWMLIVAHAAFDVTAVFIIYLNLEIHVAHLVFK